MVLFEVENDDILVDYKKKAVSPEVTIPKISLAPNTNEESLAFFLL